jgi:hypothetical protein
LDNETGTAKDRESIPGTPRWVKVFGIIALVVVAVFLVLMFAGGGRHGPSRHMRRNTTEQTSH